MTAVASPPSFANISRPAWGLNGSLHSMNPHSAEDTGRSMFTPRKTLQRTNSSSSVSSTASASSTTTTVPANGPTNGATSQASAEIGWNNSRKRGPQKSGAQWQQSQAIIKPEGPDYSRMPVSRPVQPGTNGASSLHQAPMLLGPPNQGAQARPMGEPIPMGQPVLYLLSLNGTFERKTISVPFYPDTLRIGRQTNARTVPTPVNGYFDSKVLSRQHAEIYADRAGKIWIRDVKSSNGTFVNGSRLSQENRESEPHELQTQDHLELGIDIVNEDQKSVMHHKVAAKVEHAGFLNPSQSLLDMNFGDLDPAGGQMILPPMSAAQARGRTSSQASGGVNGRMAPTTGMPVAQSNGMMAARGMWLTQPSTEAIVKKLHQEMRAAKLQANELQRTAHFLHSMTGKEDIKNSDRPEPTDPQKQQQQQPPQQQQQQQQQQQPQHAVNGGMFRSEVAKTRFSDPPAPPPQQPLPEKPDVARPNGELPSLRRGTTERPRSHTSNNTSPIRQDNLNQIIQLTETLTLARREMDNQNARIRDLEEMVQKEREARESAEDLVRKLEDSVSISQVQANGSAAKSDAQETLLAEAFEPPTDTTAIAPVANGDASGAAAADETAPDAAGAIATNKAPAEGVVAAAPTPTDAAADAAAVESAANLQACLEAIMREMRELRDELDVERKRAEKAEAERDSDRRSLAEMVAQIRQRDEEIERLAAARQSRSRSSRARGRASSRSSSSSAAAGGQRGRGRVVVGAFPETPTGSSVGMNGSAFGGSSSASSSAAGSSSRGGSVEKESSSGDSKDVVAVTGDGQPTLSRANTITPTTTSSALSRGGAAGGPTAVAVGAKKDTAVAQVAAPYASMIGVVLIGMGLMAWINGWQPPQTRMDR